MHRRPRVVLAAAAAILWSALPSEASPTDTDETPRSERLGVDLAAFGGDVELGFDELDERILWRFGMAPDGRAILRQILELRLLDALARERGLVVTEAMLGRRWEDLDRETRASGVEGGLDAYLESQGIERATFRRYLELAIVHETLTRRGLGIPDGDPLTSEQQTMWLESQITERGYSEEACPWSTGVVARCGDLTIRRDEYSERLREELPREAVRDLCYDLLLEKSVLTRMPDLAASALADAVEEEIGRRRVEVEANPEFQGVPYEKLLEAQGLSLEALRHDPAIRVAALAHLWVDRSNTDEDLRSVYTAERELFDGRHGAGVETSVLVLNAARYKNELNPRTFEEAESELEALRARIDSPEDFERLAREHSEDPRSRTGGGRIGVVAAGSPGVPSELRDAIFAALDEHPGEEVEGLVLGPVRLQGGCVLVQLGERRPAPTWDEMSAHVHRELRRRFLAERLPPDSVVTWRDAD